MSPQLRSLFFVAVFSPFLFYACSASSKVAKENGGPATTTTEARASVTKNVPRTFWVDEVAYNISSAEHLVQLYYTTMTSRRLARNPPLQETEPIVVDRAMLSLNENIKALAAIEKHLWNIRKNNTRSKINRLIFNRIQVEPKMEFYKGGRSHLSICSEDLNAIQM